MNMNELEKYSQVFEQRKTVEEFLDWLNEEEILLCSLLREGRVVERWAPILKNRQELLDKYFDIDPVQLGKERRKLLEQLRGRKK